MAKRLPVKICKSTFNPLLKKVEQNPKGEPLAKPEGRAFGKVVWIYMESGLVKKYYCII